MSRLSAGMLPVPMAVALVAAVALPGTANASTQVSLRSSADASVSSPAVGAKPIRSHWMRVGGRARWRSYMIFEVPANVVVRRAVLRFDVKRRPLNDITLRPALSRLDEAKVTPAAAPKVGRPLTRWERTPCTAKRKIRNVVCRRLSVDVTRWVTPGRPFAVALFSNSRTPLAIASRETKRRAPRLVLVTDAPSAAVSAPAASPPVGSAAAPSGPVAGIWTTTAELAGKPMSGPAWTALKKAADGSPGTPKISDQNSSHDVLTLASALVYARTKVASYRTKAAAGILGAIGTEKGGRTLALGRNLASYVIAADLIDLRTLDPAGDARFRAWLAAVRTATLSGDTLISTHETRPNNWGTMAGASRMAADVYLGDGADLDRAATVFHGWVGDRSAYAGFDYGDLSWQLDPGAPVGIAPVGASKGGLSIDGALPDDMRRGCALKSTPCHTDYAWEALQGAVVQARILARRGYDAWNWENRALLRSAQFLQRLDAQFGGWWARQDDAWQPWVLADAYGVALPRTSPAAPGKIMGWTDWVLG